MDEQQTMYLDRYCGLSEQRLKVLYELQVLYMMKLEVKINGETERRFVDHAIIDDKGLTSDGVDLMARVESIKNGTFEPMPGLPQSFADVLIPGRCARLAYVRKARIGTNHIKLLKLVAMMPGSVVGYHVPCFGWADINYLIVDGWLSSLALNRRNGWYARLLISPLAAELLRRCALDA